jgi:hypothetical protein
VDYEKKMDYLIDVCHLPQCSLLVMALFVTLHYNGKFLQGPEGAYYSKPPSHSFMVQEGTSLSGLKSQIYDCVGFNPNRCDLKLATRAMNGPMYIQVPIDNDPFWSQLCNKFKEQGFSFMELYVKRIKKTKVGVVRDKIRWRQTMDKNES